MVSDGSLSKVSPLLPRGYVDVVEAKQAGFNNINQPVVDTRACIDKPRLFPRYPAIRMR